MSIQTQDFKHRFPALARNLDTSAIEAFINTADKHHHPKGSIIIRDNTDSHTLYFLFQGTLVSFIEKDGKQINLGDTAPGSFVGEISMFGNCPTTATVMAKSDCTVLTLDASQLRQLQLIAPGLVSRLLQTITKIISARMLASDALLQQRISSGDLNFKTKSSPSFASWCTTLYQRMHTHSEVW